MEFRPVLSGYESSRAGTGFELELTFPEILYCGSGQFFPAWKVFKAARITARTKPPVINIYSE